MPLSPIGLLRNLSFYFMEKWQQKYPYYSTPIDYNMLPEIMFKIIDLSACKK